MKKKALLFVIPLILVVGIFALFLFYSPLESFVIRKILAWNTGANISYLSETYENGKIIYRDVRLAREKEFDLKASEISIHLRSELSKKRLNFECELKKPTIVLKEKGEEAYLTEGKPSFAYKNFIIHPTLKVEEGKIVLKKEEAPDIIFNLDGTFDLKGKIDLRLATETETPGTFHLKREKDKHVVKLKFDKFPLKDGGALATLFSSDFNGIFAEEGNLEGDLSYSFNNQSLKGVLFLNKAFLIDRERRFSLITETASAVFSEEPFQERSFELKLGKGAKIHFFTDKPSYPYYKMEEIGGGLTLNGDSFSLTLDGLSKYEGNPSFFQMDASGYFSGNDLQNLRTRVKLFGASQSEQSDTLLSYEKKEKGVGAFSLEVARYSPDEAKLLQKILNVHFDLPEEVVFQKGKVFAKLSGEIQENVLSRLEVEQLSLHNAHIKVPRGGWESMVDHLSGRFNFESFREGRPALNDVSGEALIENGRFYLEREDRPEPLKLEKIDSKVKIQKGHLEEVRLGGNVGGVSFGVNLDFASQFDIGFFEFQVDGDQLAELLPLPYSYTLRQAIPKDQVLLSAKLGKLDSGLFLDGKLRLLPLHEGVKQEVPFSCKAFLEMERSEKGSSLDPLPDYLTAPFKELLLSFGWDLSNWRYGIKEGQISGQNLSIEKVLTPFLFNKPVLLGKPEGKLHLSGKVSASGFFDSKGLFLTYDADDLLLENDDLIIRIPAIREGKEEFSFTELIQKGDFDLENGSLFFKKEKLLFGSFTGQAALRGEKIFIQDATTISNGVKFVGGALVDTEPEDYVKVDVKTDSIEGDLSSVRALCSLFNPHPLWDVPLHGEVASGKGGGFLTFITKPYKTTVTGEIFGSLRKGSLKNLEGDAEKINNLSTNFRVSISEKNFYFNDFKGLLNTQLGAFQFRSLGKQLYNFSDDFCLFDLELLKEGRQVGRFAGQVNYKEEATPLFQFKFSNETLIGSVPANIKDLTITEQFEIKRFLAEPVIDLKKVDNLLPLLFEGSTLSSFMNEGEVPLGGTLRFIVNYDPWDKGYHFTFTGDKIEFYDQKFEAVLCRGQYLSKKLTLDSFQADSWTAAANFELFSDSIQIGFLGLQKGNDLLLSTEGNYSLQENTYKGNLDLLEIELALMKMGGLQGRVKAEGPLQIQFDRENYLLKEADWKLNTDGLDFKGLKIAQEQPFSFVKAEGKASKVKDFKAEIIQIDQFDTKIPLEVDAFTLRKGGGWEIERLHFTIPEVDRQLLSDWTITNFPKYETWIKKGGNLKPEGDLGGTLSGKGKETPDHLELSLVHGDYKLGSSEFAISAPVVRIEEDALSFTAFVDNEQKSFWFRGTTKLSDTSKLSLFVAEDPLSTSEAQEGLTVEMQEIRGDWLPSKVTGSFCGVKPHLDYQLRLRDGSYQFDGYVDVDFKQAKELLQSPVKEIVENSRAGDGYRLSGSFILGGGENLRFDFKGELRGEEFLLYDYRIKEASTYLELNTREIVAEKFEMKDPAGLLTIEKVHLLKDEDSWAFSLPHLVATDIQPGLLSTVDFQNNFVKTFVIDHLEFYEFQGVFHNRDTWQGRGTFSFVNPSKHNVKNTLWTIPEDIISRIGLNLEIFQPVVGTIDFTLDEGKVNLDSFTDVYSKNKISRFYLSRSAGRSFIDLHSGVINAKIRMKQHNLLFKIAELFTISIEGHILSPSYNVDKRKSSGNSEKEE